MCVKQSLTRICMWYKSPGPHTHTLQVLKTKGGGIHCVLCDRMMMMETDVCVCEGGDEPKPKPSHKIVTQTHTYTHLFLNTFLNFFLLLEKNFSLSPQVWRMLLLQDTHIHILMIGLWDVFYLPLLKLEKSRKMWRCLLRLLPQTHQVLKRSQIGYYWHSLFYGAMHCIVSAFKCSFLSLLFLVKNKCIDISLFQKRKKKNH